MFRRRLGVALAWGVSVVAAFVLGVMSPGLVHPDTVDPKLRIPRGAQVSPFGTHQGFFGPRLSGFWVDEGEADAPDLKLRIADGAYYHPNVPNSVALELRCDPWANGIVFGSGAVALGMERPSSPPGPELVLKAGEETLSGPVHPRDLGVTDLAVPGAFVPAADADLQKLAGPRTFLIQWGARSAALPAPPPALMADFIEKCSGSFEFAAGRG